MKNIVITGPPGIGKTTLVKKIINKLSTLQYPQKDVDGFYTEEVRNNNRRIGFDIVTLDGQRAILARKGSNELPGEMPTVGQYVVHLDDFEKLALPIFEKSKKLLVIDEIGKMELFSTRFEERVKKVIESRDVKVIATVPIKGGSLVQQIKKNRDTKLITVNQDNRDCLLDEIVELFTK
ncbi:hypothetical protein NQ317_015108 [Molorchus minor]|uniref:AAA+ ATPase domain-containing protein n=1 Tax=Molorchus minor TaxID=1323400 RepID=A0ABQ9K4T7_9CUCU|nr:hypothetical protein NQ317_015108 [Molorchus minor]